ncbi:MAG: glycoside hydrolase family 57 protein [Terriglobia bacterium]
MPPTRLVLLWHMHQPYYKDLAQGRYAMPWTRLHTLKDYFGMVAMIRDFPSVHMTFNLVPSLVAQIIDYARDQAREESDELAFKPAQDLTPPEKQKLVKYAFQVNHENLMSRYPRFVELFSRAKGNGNEPDAGQISGLHEILDLQVLSQIAWFDEIYLASDPEISALVARGRNYSERDKAIVRAKELEICKATLEEYRKAQERGQIEISTSPFYHPILPLLCDSDVGAESCAGLLLPRQRFRHPEDARAQLRAAIALHEEVFGVKPRGLWPSEGSVSEDALRLAAEEGFIWAAADEGVLGRSLHTFFHRRTDARLEEAHRLYRPYRLPGSPLSVFFRDHQLSDLIGFVYSRMDPESAAQDLVARIRAASRDAGEAVVSIILDGENAWEYYPGNGREFLKRFYSALEASPDIQALTPTEALAVADPEPLPRLVPGSWINANFNVWIGAEEDNRAWDLLNDARRFFADRSGNPALARRDVRMAQQELWIAEGSDWCWWYGPEHSTANDEEFDQLYRQHLGNLYRLLGAAPPDELAEPIKRPRTGGYNVPPSAAITPAIDGLETTYFEWLGAGIYMPDSRSASLHQAAGGIREVHYGSNNHGILLRIDLAPEFLKQSRDFELRVNFRNSARLLAKISSGTLREAQLWLGEQLSPSGSGFRAAFESIFEAELSYAALGLGPHQKTAFQISFWVDHLPLQRIPREGWLSLEVTEDGTQG